MADDEAVERDEDQAGATEDEQSEESRKAKEKEEEREQAKETMKKIEEDPPDDLEDWPDDAAKYETFGGPEGEHSYEEGPETQLGPSSLRHKEDGGVTIEGEEVDDPDEYKSDPIPGGPTDDNSTDLTAKRIRERQDKTEPGEEEAGTDRSSGGDKDGDDESS
jgi:hypothetical protein